MKILFVVYDQNQYMNTFPLGIAYLTSVLKLNGDNVYIYDQAIEHTSEEHLLAYINNNNFDIIGLSFIGGYYQYKKAIEISDVINKSKKRNKFLYILGGHGPSPEPKFFLRKLGADIIVLGEGENTIVDISNAVKNNISYYSIPGIAFIDNNNIFQQTEPRELIKDMDTIPFPAYNMFDIKCYRLIRYTGIKKNEFAMNMLSGRGCNFSCNFCMRLDKGLRIRNNEAIIDEIKMLKQQYNISYIAFQDELLMNSINRTINFSEAIINSNLNIKWRCNGRLNFATKEVLDTMKRSGCVFINYGIECLDDQVLKNMNKSLTVDIIIRGIENTLKSGISPGYNIIWGNIGDNRETLKKSIDFLLKYDDQGQFRTVRPVTPYPGSPLYYYAIEKGLLKNCEDFYENKHINSDLLSVNFTNISDDSFHIALLEENTRLINNYFEKQANNYIKQATDLYTNKNIEFRGFRQK